MATVTTRIIAAAWLACLHQFPLSAPTTTTVLVDLDLQFGDVAHTLQLTPEQTLSDAVSRAAARDTMVLKSFLSAHPTGIFAICAPDSPGAEAQISAEDITHLLDQLAAQ